jgi:hypothetical protein
MLCRVPSWSVMLVPVSSTATLALQALPPPVVTMQEPLMAVTRNPSGRFTPRDANVPGVP